MICQVSSGVLTGVLNISPEKIQAVDMDSINAAIEYSFLSGTPSNFLDCFKIDPSSGAVRQIKPVDSSLTKNFEIIVKVSFRDKINPFPRNPRTVNMICSFHHPWAINPVVKDGERICQKNWFFFCNKIPGWRIDWIAKIHNSETQHCCKTGRRTPAGNYYFGTHRVSLWEFSNRNQSNWQQWEAHPSYSDWRWFGKFFIKSFSQITFFLDTIGSETFLHVWINHGYVFHWSEWTFNRGRRRTRPWSAQPGWISFSGCGQRSWRPQRG